MNILNNIDENDLPNIGKRYNYEYMSAKPFPNFYFDELFNNEFLNKVLEEFPNLNEIADYNFRNENEKKTSNERRI